MPPAIHATNVRFVDGCYPGLQTFSRGGRRALGGAGTAPPAPAKGGRGEVATARTPLAEMPRSTPCARRRADVRSLSRLRPRFVAVRRIGRHHVVVGKHFLSPSRASCFRWPRGRLVLSFLGGRLVLCFLDCLLPQRFSRRPFPPPPLPGWAQLDEGLED